MNIYISCYILHIRRPLPARLARVDGSSYSSQFPTLTTPRQPKQRLPQTPRFSDPLDSEILRATSRIRLSI